MLLSVGTKYTSSTTGYIYEIQALTPMILYSPIKTYTTRLGDSRIFQREANDFMNRFLEGGSDFTLTFNGQPLGYQQQILTRTIA